MSDPFKGGTITPAPSGDIKYVLSAGRVFDSSIGQWRWIGLLQASWPPVIGYGDGLIRIEWSTSASTIVENLSATTTSYSKTTPLGGGSPPLHYYVKIYKQTTYGDILIDQWVSASGTTNGTITKTRPTRLHFTGQRTEANTLQLWLWPVGGTKPVSPVSVPKLVNTSGVAIDGWFAFDCIGHAAGDYEYEFRTSDASGNELDHVKGVVTLGPDPVVSSKFIDTVQPVFTPGAPVTNIITRAQTHNAFGEVTQEIDGRGYATEFVYNALGQLIKKTDPQTEITQDNGAVMPDTPRTYYYYDAIGPTVAMRDANGNLTSQRYDAAGNLVAEYHADGGLKASKPWNWWILLLSILTQ